jgi:hypothetical protein
MGIFPHIDGWMEHRLAFANGCWRVIEPNLSPHSVYNIFVLYLYNSIYFIKSKTLSMKRVFE